MRELPLSALVDTFFYGTRCTAAAAASCHCCCCCRICVSEESRNVDPVYRTFEHKRSFSLNVSLFFSESVNSLRFEWPSPAKVHSLFTCAAFHHPKVFSVSTAPSIIAATASTKRQRLPHRAEQVDYSSGIGSFVRFILAVSDERLRRNTSIFLK